MKSKKILIILLLFVKNCYAQYPLTEYLENSEVPYYSLNNYRFGVNGSIKSIVIKEVYNDTLNNNIVEMKSNELGEVYELNFKYKTTNGPKSINNIINYNYHETNSTRKIITSKLDSRNNPLEVYLFIDSLNKYRFLSYEYKYDSLGNIVSSVETLYAFKNFALLPINIESKNKYDKPDFEDDYFKGLNDIDFKYYNYYSNSLLIKRVGIYNNDTASVFNFCYFNNNHIKSFEKYGWNSFYSDSKIRMYLKRIFNINGFVLVEERKDSLDGEELIKFKYDKNGNISELNIISNKTLNVYKNDGSKEFLDHLYGDMVPYGERVIKNTQHIKSDSNGRKYLQWKIDGHGASDKNLINFYDKIGNISEVKCLDVKFNYNFIKKIYQIKYFENNTDIQGILYRQNGYYGTHNFGTFSKY